MVPERKSGALEGQATVMAEEEEDPALDWDSDETVIDGSVAEGDLEGEELRWRRLSLDQEIAPSPEFSLHSGLCEEHLQGFRPGKDPEKQACETKKPVPSEDAILQQTQDKMEQNQALLQTALDRPGLTQPFPQPAFSWDLLGVQGLKAEESEVLILTEKNTQERSEDTDSPEVSLLTGVAVAIPDPVAVKEKWLMEPEQISGAAKTLPEPGNEVTLAKNSEESSVETFVSAIERSRPSPEVPQEGGWFGILRDFEPGPLMGMLSSSSSPISLSLSCHGGFLEATEAGVLSEELLDALNALSETQPEPLSPGKGDGASVTAGGRCVAVREPGTPEMDMVCTCTAGPSPNPLRSAALSEQEPKSPELPSRHLPAQRTVEDPDTFGLQTVIHQTVATYDPLDNSRNSSPVENNSDQLLITPSVLRRSSRLKGGRSAEHTDVRCSVPEDILSKILDCDDQTDDSASTENLRMHDPAPLTEGKEKSKHPPRRKSGEPNRRIRKMAEKYEKVNLSRLTPSGINRRNIFGENLVYRAALQGDTDTVRRCLQKGGHVGQRSYAGWTALHEVCVRGFYQTAHELLKGGADVNARGMYQITPLHDAVMNEHYKVAELLLLHGADPLLRGENGKCALDEARDPRMKDLLERHVPRRHEHLLSAPKSSPDPSDGEDSHQHKKPKRSSKTCTEYVCDDENHRQKPEQVQVDNGGDEGLFISAEKIHEHFQKDPGNPRSGEPQRQQSPPHPKCPAGLREDSLHAVRAPGVSAAMGEGRQEGTQAEHAELGAEVGEDALVSPSSSRGAEAGEDALVSPSSLRGAKVGEDALVSPSSSRGAEAGEDALVSPSSSPARRAQPQQPAHQVLCGLPEESCSPSGLAPTDLENGAGSSLEACLGPRGTQAQSPDSLRGQQGEPLGPGSPDRGDAAAASLSGVSPLPSGESLHGATDQQPPPHGGQLCPGPREPHGDSPACSRHESSRQREEPGPSPLEEEWCSDGGDSGDTEKTGRAGELVGSAGHGNSRHPQGPPAQREEAGSPEVLFYEDRFSQDGEMAAAGLAPLQQLAAVCPPDSDATVISEECVADYDQPNCGTPSDGPARDSECAPGACPGPWPAQGAPAGPPCGGPPKGAPGPAPQAPAPYPGQAEDPVMENQTSQSTETEGNCPDKGRETGSSAGSSPPGLPSQVTETAQVREGGRGLPDSSPGPGLDAHTAGGPELTLTSLSPLGPRGKDDASWLPDAGLTPCAREGDSTLVNHEEEKDGNAGSKTHEPPHSHEGGKARSLREARPALQAARGRAGDPVQALQAARGRELKTAGVNKRNAHGESRLHLAAKGGNVSLVKVLIASGADVNLKDNAGWTPLHEAASKGCSDVIVALLEAGADVNCENVDGILPLHDAVANNHFKAAEILLKHGANPNQKDQNQRTALDEAGDSRMEELLKAYGALETDAGEEARAEVADEAPAVRAKRQKQCDDCESLSPSPRGCQRPAGESQLVHQNISTVLHDIEEQQENLLASEIRSPADAEQYIEKMLEIKKVLSSVLAKQKAERDDLAKKYRVSIDSFKHGLLREQLANLAARQKSLLVVTRRQKEVSLNIQRYKELASLPERGPRKPLAGVEATGEGAILEPARLEGSAPPQPRSPAPVSLVHGSPGEAQLSLETRGDGQSPSPCLQVETGSGKNVSGNELHSEQDVEMCAWDGSWEAGWPEGTGRVQSLPPPVACTALTEHSHDTRADVAAEGSEACRPPPAPATPRRPGTTGYLARVDHTLAVPWDQALSGCDSRMVSGEATPQWPPGAAPGPLAPQTVAAPRGDAEPLPGKPPWGRSACAGPHAGEDRPAAARKPPGCSPAPRRRCTQIKDLMVLGKVLPGVDVLEVKMQETIHKASILRSGKIQVENGQVYQSPATWLKALLGGRSRVTWNYAWSKVMYLGKELLKYVSEEEHPAPDLDKASQQGRPCPPAVSAEPVQSIPHYLQINEILLISDQEFLPPHVMDQHWSAYAACTELTL